MQKKSKWLALALTIVLSFSLLPASALAASGQVQATLDYRDIHISVDGAEITPTDAKGEIVEPFAMNGTVYLPLRAISETLGLDVEWNDATGTVVINTAKPLDFALADADETVQGFVCVADKAGKVYWQAGLNSFDEVFQTFGLTDDGTYVKAFAVPDNGEDYPFLYPEKPWKGFVSGDMIPDWFTAGIQSKVSAAFKQWKEDVYSLFDYEGLRALSAYDSINAAPAADYQVTAEDLAALKGFVEIEDSLLVNSRDSVLYTVEKYCGTAIKNDISNFYTAIARILPDTAISKEKQSEMGVMPKGVTSSNYLCDVVGTYFNFDEWLYCNLETEGYPYACSRYLFERGLFPWRDDGTNNWYLSSAKGDVFYCINDSEIGPAQAFSCLVDVNGSVYWRVALDSASALEKAFADDIQGEYICAHVKPVLAKEDATIELPDGKDPSIMHNYVYFDPASTWTLSIEGDTPAWFTAESEEKVMTAFDAWYAAIYDKIDFEGIRKIFISQPEEIAVTDEDVVLLRQWARQWQDFTDRGENPASKIKGMIYENFGMTVWADLMEYVTADWRVHHTTCTGAAISKGYLAYKGDEYSALKSTVSDSVLDMQTALTANYLKGIDWGTGSTEYPYQGVAQLVEHGLIPSTDGVCWYLTNIDTEDAEIIYEIPVAELLADE